MSRTGGAPARRWGGAAAALGVAAPIAATALLAWRYFLPLPLADYWDALYGASFLGPGLEGLWQYLWAPFVDQRMVLPKAVILGLSRLTQNRHYGLEIALSLVLQAGTLGLCVAMIARMEWLSVGARRFLAVVASAFLFWPALYLRFQHHWYATQYGWAVFLGVLALFLLARGPGRWGGVAGGLLAGVGAAYAHGTGAVVLPAGAVLLSLDRRWRWGQRLLWWVAVGVCGATILAAPSGAAGCDPPTAALLRPLRVGRFVVRALAAPLGGTLTGVALAGLVAACLFGLRRRWGEPSLIFWRGIVLWCVGVAGVTAVARSPVRWPAPWYACFFVLFPLTAAALLVAALPRRGVWGGAVLFGALGVVWVERAAAGVAAARRLQREVLVAAAKLRFAPLLGPADTRVLFPFPRFRRTILPALAHRGWLGRCVDLRPLTRRVSCRFRVAGATGLEVAGSPADVLRLRLTASPASLVLRPERPFGRDRVLALRLAAPPGVRGRLYWDDGRGWGAGRSQGLRRRVRRGRLWFLFVDAEDPRGRRPVCALKFVFAAPTLPVEVCVRELRLWTHADLFLEGPHRVTPGGTLRLRFRVPEEAGRFYVAAAAWSLRRRVAGGAWPLAVDGLHALSADSPGLFRRFRGVLPAGGAVLEIHVPAWGVLGGRRFYVAAATVGAEGLRCVSVPHEVWIAGGRGE